MWILSSAAAFEAEGLLRSLRCGEPGRVARFLALEAGHAASWGQRGQQRAGRMLQQSETVAQGSGDPHALGLVRLVEGIAACLRGRWIDAVRLCDEAAAIFRDRCTGVAWESDTSQAWAVSALTWQGEVAEIARRLPRLQAESQKRGKLYALRGLYARNLVKLAGDDPDTAERYAQLFRDQWPRGPFYLQHLTELREQLQVDLYRGNGEQAWARIQRHWWKLRASFLLRVALVRGGMYEIRARCALAAAARASRPERLRRLALNDARRLEKERQPWMQPMAQLIRATRPRSGASPHQPSLGWSRRLAVFSRPTWGFRPPPRSGGSASCWEASRGAASAASPPAGCPPRAWLTPSGWRRRSLPGFLARRFSGLSSSQAARNPPD